MQLGEESTRALLDAAEAALAWVDALEQHANSAELTRLYESWVQQMWAAVAQVTEPAGELAR